MKGWGLFGLGAPTFSPIPAGMRSRKPAAKKQQELCQSPTRYRVWGSGVGVRVPAGLGGDPYVPLLEWG